MSQDKPILVLGREDVKEGKMTIESHSPTGNGTMWADYDIEGTEWQKY